MRAVAKSATALSFHLNIFSMTREDAAYTAGMFDGEGHVQVTKYGVGFKICILDHEVIDWMRTVLGGRSLTQAIRGNQPRTAYIWWEGRMAEVNRIGRLWLPFLRIKQNEVAAAVAFNEYRLSIGKFDKRRPDYEIVRPEYERLHAAIQNARDERYCDYI